jgi:uncharacterized membrane protein required for colicin V production
MHQYLIYYPNLTNNISYISLRFNTFCIHFPFYFHALSAVVHNHFLCFLSRVLILS